MIRISRGIGVVAAVALLAGGGGCTQRRLTLIDVGRPIVVAVAPALNHSGSRNVDPVAFADLMFSELNQVPGLRVLPVNRVLAQLESESRTAIESPGHAFSMIDRLGADAIVVFAITEYDPYEPPVVGIAAHLYGYGPAEPSGFDPISASRAPSPVEAAEGEFTWFPRAEYQRVFHGSDAEVVAEIRRFAERRDADNSPHGWRKFLATQENYLRFCFATAAQELIRQEVSHVVHLHERKTSEVTQ